MRLDQCTPRDQELSRGIAHGARRLRRDVGCSKLRTKQVCCARSTQTAVRTRRQSDSLASDTARPGGGLTVVKPLFARDIVILAAMLVDTAAGIVTT